MRGHSGEIPCVVSRKGSAGELDIPIVFPGETAYRKPCPRMYTFLENTTRREKAAVSFEEVLTRPLLCSSVEDA